MLADDVVADAETQAGAPVGWLGGEEGIEYVVDYLRGNAVAVVPDIYLNGVYRSLGGYPQGGLVVGVIRCLSGLFVDGIAGVADNV